MVRFIGAELVALAVVTTACNLPSTSAPGSAPTSTFSNVTPPAASSSPPQTAAVPASPPPDHHIGIRVVNGVGEFFNRRTGSRFVPRGMNYVRLGAQPKADGSSTFGHSLFDPGTYAPARIRADLQKMHTDGYNVVRVFLSPETLGTASGGLSTAYMSNVVDLLEHARDSQMYVMFTLDWIPGGIYGEILNRDCCTTFAMMNANFLPAAGLRANETFFRDFAEELLSLHAPTDYVWSYELRNEMFYDTDQPPLSLRSGSVTTANGKSYDMSSATDKQKMVEENNVYWIDSVRSAILEVDPTSLVSVGFFVPQAPNPARIGDARLVVSAPALWQSQADFIDVHAYPGYELNLAQTVQNFGMENMKQKPIVMGEFGGEVARFSSVQAAALKFIDWQVESCKYGFDGWIFWTWDLSEQADFFNALMGDGAINGALAPVLRPNPCLP